MGENHILAVLKRSLEEGLMVAVYLNRDQPESSSVGFITSLSAEQFVMKHVTPDGLSDGYLIRRVEDVFRVDVSGEYEQRVKLLYTLQKQQHEDFLEKTVDLHLNLFKEAFIIAQKKKLVVTVCIDELEEQNDIVGFVKDVYSEGITISQISFHGLDDGESTFFIEDVVKVNCNTIDEKNLKLLFEHRNQ